MLDKTEKQIWLMYHHMKRKDENISVPDYCNSHGINKNSFQNFKTRYNCFFNGDKERYDYWSGIYNKFLEEKTSIEKFITNHGVDRTTMTVFCAHKKYQEIINHLINIGFPPPDLGQKAIKKEEMKFISVSPQSEQKLAPKQEIFHEQNTIELKVSNGIKVIVSPEVPPEKLIKIIKLLKDF